MSNAADQLLIHHVHELRRRLAVSAGFLITVSGAAYFYKDTLTAFFTHPLHQQLVYTAPGGGFQFILQICLTVGVVVSLPVFIYELIQFIRPAFEKVKMTRRATLAIITASYCLALLGIAFAYWVVLPMSFHFFASFQIGGVKAMISTSKYLSFVLGCIIAFAVVFQVPMLLIIYNHINRFPPGRLGKFRKFVIIGSLVLAVLLPFSYDPITQLAIAAPIIILYELSLLAIWAINHWHDRYVGSGYARRAPLLKSAPTIAQPPRKIMPLPDQPTIQPIDRTRSVQLG